MPLLTKSDVGTDVHPGLKGPTDPTAGAHTHSAATMVPDQSRAERTQSYAVADFPVPHGREEDWRFTPVAELAALFAAAVRAKPAGHSLCRTSGYPGFGRRMSQIGG